MRIEVPECARCCACLPLRYGIITLGFMNIGFNILLLAVETWLGWLPNESVTTMYRGVRLRMFAIVPMILYSLEIVFHLWLVVGAFMKRAWCLRLYYYYGLITSSAALACFVLGLTDREMINGYSGAFAFCGMILQLYLILLVRSQLLRWKRTHCYVSHAGEMAVPAAEDADPFL